MAEQHKVEVRRTRDANYRQIFVAGVFGGHRLDHFEMIIQSQGIDAAETQKTRNSVVELKDEICLKMSPEQAKATYLWLGEHIAAFEKEFRPIELRKSEKPKAKDAGFTV